MHKFYEDREKYLSTKRLYIRLGCTFIFDTKPQETIEQCLQSLKKSKVFFVKECYTQALELYVQKQQKDFLKFTRA